MKNSPTTLRDSPDLLQEALPTAYRVWLAALVFTAFLTQTKFIPSIRNNIGPFEIAGLLLIIGFFISPRTSRPLKLNGTIQATIGILVLVCASQINIPGNRRGTGFLHVAIQIFFVLFLITLFNIWRQYRVSPRSLLQWVGLAVLIVGPWIIYSGLDSSAAVQEVGPFRNRAHMASYMLTTFWIVLVYSQWPGLRWRHKLVAYAGVGMALYAVAIAGRRSVYLSLLFGLAGLAVTFLLARRQSRWRLIVAGIFVAGTIYAMYQIGPQYLPQLKFFQSRVAMIDDRLGAALAVSQDEAAEKGFFALQREGVRRAFLSNPVLGMGWGGFAKSHYSPTGHEVHSTPLRFLAETGLLGFALYIVFMLSMVRSVWRGFLWMRRTPYGNAYLVLAIGFSSLLVSYAYNRHVTERTFWILTALIFATELFAHRVHDTLRQPATSRPAAQAQLLPRPPRPRAVDAADPAATELWPTSS